jgi:RNA polymerase sigma factor (sigma-70 family)
LKPRSGSVSAEELLAEAGFLQRLARELVSDAHAATDLAQETLVVALERPPRAEGSLRGWLATVAANLARNARRSQRRREQREQFVARSERAEGDELGLERLEQQRLLFTLLLTLPAEQRTVLYLRYYEGRAPTAIAERLGVPLKTVKTRHTRAIAALREKLDARSSGDRSRWMEALAPLAVPHGSGVAGGVIEATIGGIVVKKLVLVGVAALLVLLAWFALPHGALDSDLGATGRTTPVDLGQATPPTSPVSAPELRAEPREPLSAPAPAATGGLDVHLSWSDGTPATDIGLIARCENPSIPRVESSRGRTDAQGALHFADLFAGKVTLFPDMRERFETEVEAGTTRTIEHTLPAGFQVEGRVVDPAGQPVATASIWCKGSEPSNPDTHMALTCGGDGSFRLRDVSARATFGARARNFLPTPSVSPEDVPIGALGVRTVELQLGASGGRVSGRVLDADGAPLEHARVLCGPPGRFQVQLKSGIHALSTVPATVETGQDGRFELIDDFEPSVQPIFATARGCPVWEGQVKIEAGRTAFVEIRLERSARIEGRLLGFDGAPVAGARIRASKEERGGWFNDMFPPSKSVSDAQGRFTLDWVRPGSCEINAEDFQRPEIGRAHASVTCSAGETTVCDLRLERGNTISGRVQDKSGSPLAGWGVYSETASLMRQWYPRNAKSAADGSFTLLNLGDGEHNLAVRGPDLGPPRARAFKVATGTKDVVLIVADADVQQGTLRARIVDSSGHTLEDVKLTLWRTGANEGHFLDFDTRTGALEARAQPGLYRIEVGRGGLMLSSSAEFTLEESKVTELGDLTFGPSGRVEVRITGLPGDVVRPDLSLLSVERWAGSRLELQDGVWRAGDLAAGRWVVSAGGKGFCLRGGEFEIVSGTTVQLEMHAEPAVPVELSFTNPGAGDVTITARDGQGQLLCCQRVGLVQRERASRFAIYLPAGQASVEVRTLEGLVGKVEIDVNASLHTPVDIVLR